MSSSRPRTSIRQRATGARVSVPANDRVEVRFPMSAKLAGTARFQGRAPSPAQPPTRRRVELPVYTPATSEAFATYGVVDDGAVVQPVLAPTDVLAQFGGLDVSTSSTSLQALTDAVLYLTDYPYESSDALASRILAIVALRDVLDAFDAPGLPSAERAGRDRGGRRRGAHVDAERRRWLPVLAARAAVRAVQLRAGHPRARRRPRCRVPRRPGRRRVRPVVPHRHREPDPGGVRPRDPRHDRGLRPARACPRRAAGSDEGRGAVRLARRRPRPRRPRLALADPRRPGSP